MLGSRKAAPTLHGTVRGGALDSGSRGFPPFGFLLMLMSTVWDELRWRSGKVTCARDIMN